MKVINFSAGRFAVGRTVIMRQPYVNGNIVLVPGDRGTITDITVETFTDLGIFDLRVVHIDFGKCKLSMGEQIAKNYLRVAADGE